MVRRLGNCIKDGKWQYGCNGGQSPHAARQIADRLSKIPHEVYVEPFLGNGTVFRAKEPSVKEVVNDKDCKRLHHALSIACSSSPTSEKCQRLKSARQSCGRDYTSFKNYDSKKTLFYLDPPYHTGRNSNRLYKYNEIDFPRFVKWARGLKGNVAISYSNTPETRKELCKAPFTCHSIHKNIFTRHWNELLAVKKAGRVFP